MKSSTRKSNRVAMKISVLGSVTMVPHILLPNRVKLLLANAHPLDEMGTIITPEVAKMILDIDVEGAPKRNIRSGNKARIKQAMRDGRYRLVPDPIMLHDPTGFVLNARHRLEACIEIGKPFLAVVMKTPDMTLFEVIDTNAIRNNSDTLAATGEKNTAILAASAGVVWRYFRGWPTRAQAPTNEEVIGILAAHPGLRDSVRFMSVHRDYPARFCQHSNLVAAHYLFNKVSEIDANEMLVGLIEGIGLQAGSPVLRLRNRFLADSAVKARLSPPEKMALLIKCWNVLRSKGSIRTLRWSPNANEPFPTIAGLSIPSAQTS